jgi:hypothetical protein
MQATKLNGSSQVTWYFLLLVIAAVGIFYGRSLSDLHANLRVWQPDNLLYLLLGLPFVLLQGKAGLPPAFPTEPKAARQLLLPLFTGLLFGLADLLVIEVLINAVPHSQLPNYTQPFPYSVLLYTSGAFEVEVFYRLIPITLVLLLAVHFKKGKYVPLAFALVAVLTSLREPLEQLPANPIWLVTYSFATGFAMNFFQALFFQKRGFSSSLVLRLGHYLIWHVFNGLYIEYFLLPGQ